MVSGVLGLWNAPRQHRRWISTVSRVTSNKLALSWVSRQPQTPLWESHLPYHLLIGARCWELEGDHNLLNAAFPAKVRLRSSVPILAVCSLIEAGSF